MRKLKTAPSNKHIAIWLFICCALVLVMTGLGGYTRLTDSGLSMTNWHPIHGSIPPLTTEQWQEEFTNYKSSPEYQLINKGFDLSEFKNIFFVEYAHRMLGRTIGFCFLIPFLWFLIRRQLSAKLSLKLVEIFALGGLQGLMGWYMVKSGLVDVPHVSHYRLAAHLMLSMLLFSLLFWTGLTLWFSNTVPTQITQTSRTLFKFSIVLIALIVLQTVLGAFTAGLDAGLMYNTFPLMDGKIVPEGLLLSDPWYSNLYNNPITVQFLHRMNAMIILVLGIAFWFKGRVHLQTTNISSRALNMYISILLIQVILGVSTLLLQVPVQLGVTHQVIAFALLATILFICHRLYHEVSK